MSWGVVKASLLPDTLRTGISCELTSPMGYDPSSISPAALSSWSDATAPPSECPAMTHCSTSGAATSASATASGTVNATPIGGFTMNTGYPAATIGAKIRSYARGSTSAPGMNATPVSPGSSGMSRMPVLVVWVAAVGTGSAS